MNFFLAGIFFLSLLLRLYTAPQNLFFASEQGRDLFVLNDILQNHKLTLIGPRTSIEGIFHGVLYYYFSFPAFVIGAGDPLAVMILYVTWQAAGVFFLYLLCKEYLNKEAAVFCSLLYATSYGLIIYSRWLSHPPLIIPLAIIMFWLLLKISQGNIKFYILLTVVWSAVFHFDLVVAIFLLPVIFLFFFWQKTPKPTVKIMFISISALAVSLSSYILFELRHNFLMLSSLKLFLSRGVNVPNDLTGSFSHYVFRYSQEIKDIFGPNLQFTMILFIVLALPLLFKREKKSFDKLLLLWLIFIPTIGIFFNPLFGLKHYLVGLSPILIIALGWRLSQLTGVQRWLGRGIVFILLLNNLILIKDFLPVNYNVFYLDGHRGMVLKNEHAVIDYIYKDAGKKNFGWEAFTIPYWQQSGWKYLFSWYGTKTYGYSPGKLKKGDIFYVIIEPGADKLYLNRWLKEKMDPRGKLVAEISIDEIVIQKRNTSL